MKWIKCSDRLPDNKKPILFVIDKHWGPFGVQNGYHNGNVFLTCCLEFPQKIVIKWMPLPDGDNDEEQ